MNEIRVLDLLIKVLDERYAYGEQNTTAEALSELQKHLEDYRWQLAEDDLEDK